ncbi:hypothetical protein DRW07_16140 [Alteromonas sediminis]|uniref:Uncharacterized protein n=1 Tax=Alteromonas sediminis TaxID=2259342 RepID=A0A3N5XXA2_9ALTE|nr:hypothetical protein [Alteromonas sediminis]RPJ65432.1 hypothetical protein DRW07_16140 [Alteromonas sediminis]
MKCITENKQSVIFSLVWAGVILLSAYLSQGEDFASTALIFAITGWYISYHYFFKPQAAGCCRKKSSADGSQNVNDGGN